mmetsp:Transcript_18400/g.29802  ORF Transcript_18400/g.29802 Transcript_18400/m.29802 type:complete len:348 (+) Transcript_18400:2953-3996(+)
MENRPIRIRLFKHIRHRSTHQRRAHWEIARGDPLGATHHIGLNAPMAAARPIAGPAKSCDDLIGNHQNAVSITNLAHQRHERLMRDNHAARALNRLHYERRNAARPLELDLILHRRRDVLRQFGGVGFLKRVAIGIGRGQVKTAGHQRLVSDAKPVVAVDRSATKMGPVIALLQRQKLGAPWLSLDAVILAGQPQTGFHRIRAAGGEKRPCHAVRFEKFAHRIRRLNRRRVRGARKGRIVGQIVELLGNRLFDHIVGIAKVHAPQAPHGIDHLVPVDVFDRRAAGTGDDRRRIGHRLAGMTHRVPHMLSVVGAQKIVVFHGSGLRLGNGRMHAFAPSLPCKSVSVKR